MGIGWYALDLYSGGTCSILNELFDYLVISDEFPPPFQANPGMAPVMRPLPLPQLYKRM
jgi:hypothetical protein